MKRVAILTFTCFVTIFSSVSAQVEQVRTIDRARELGFTISEPVYMFTVNGVRYYRADGCGKQKRGLQNGRCVKGVGPCIRCRFDFDEFGVIQSVTGKQVMDSCDEEAPVRSGQLYYDRVPDEIWID